MHTLDLVFLSLPLLLIVVVGLYTRRYLKSVADFLSAGRLAGPYLLAVAGGEMQAGAVVFVAMFEVISKAGFTLSWWQAISFPVGIVVAISGFVIYRFRETRALTLGQFFELRYSKSFRVFTGILAFLAGIANFGIIPAVGARCMVYFLGLPATLAVFSWEIPTYIPLMAAFLSITLLITLSGGFITVMITDCVEGIMTQVAYLAIIVALLLMFSWTEVSDVLLNRPPGQSLVNPFDSQGVKDFNLWFVLMTIFVGVYGTRAWQNASGYNAAAISPHAAVMGGILGRWRELGKGAVVTLLAICAITYLNHPDFSSQAAAVEAEVGQIESAKIQEQMRIPIAVSHLLPIGIKGILCAILIMGIFGGDSTHLHSWSGIFVQDILVPLRKKPFLPGEHIKVLRMAVFGVALFAFLFGIFFQQTEYIVMWWQVTTAIFVGGAGACIVGGLYWNRGTTAAAWTALLAGSGLSVGGIAARQIFGNEFPLNGTQISFIATLVAIALYAGVSLLTSRNNRFNLDRMLHRGEYETPEGRPSPAQPRRAFAWGKLLGVDKSFTRGDRWVAGSLFTWSVFWFAVFVAVSIWNLIAPWPNSVWAGYWRIAGVGVPIVVCVITGIWFTWGGVRDIRALFTCLRFHQANHLDDGTVAGHQNLDERRITETTRPKAEVPR